VPRYVLHSQSWCFRLSTICHTLRIKKREKSVSVANLTTHRHKISYLTSISPPSLYCIALRCIALSKVWQIIFHSALPLSQQVHSIYFLACLRVFFRKQSNNTVPLLQWSLVGPWKPSQHNFGVLHCSMTSLMLDDTQFFDPKVIQNETLFTMLTTFVSVLHD